MDSNATTTEQTTKQNPEETATDQIQEADEAGLIKGMRQLQFKNVVEDLQHKSKTWDDLKVPKFLQDRLFDFKMDRPSKIQAHAIPKILECREDNFLFHSSNGSGKTLAFGIPSIITVDPEVQAVQVIIIANTRELIRQVQQVLSEFVKDSPIGVAIGDQQTPEQPTQQILVTVPKWLEQRVKGRKKMNLQNLKMVVYDEADEIFLQESNHLSIKILSKYMEDNKLQTQTVLFSATYPEEVVQNIQGFLPKFRMFRVPNKALKLEGVKQFQIPMMSTEKLDFIKDIYLQFEKSQTMIFCNKKVDAQNLQAKLKQETGIHAEILTGQIDQGQRDQIIDDFRKTSITTLICTNVLARGIDVPEVDLVINYEVPFISKMGFWVPDFANYLHRVGRTGRFGTDGVALNIIDSDDERKQDLIDDIAKHYQIEIKPIGSIDELKAVIDEMRKEDDDA